MGKEDNSLRRWVSEKKRNNNNVDKRNNSAKHIQNKDAINTNQQYIGMTTARVGS